MRLAADEWTLKHLQAHLQAAVDLEFWTIPFYMSTMYSVVDRTSGAVQLIQTIVNQEMLHVQLAANIANSFGLSPDFKVPVYEGTKIPHLDFALDNPDPRPHFKPHSAEIGPLDERRINAMCLIEYPEWKTGHQPDLRDTVSEYGSIGEFYDAIQYGATLLKAHIRGGVNQVDHFAPFYNAMPQLTVTDSGAAGLNQVILLINTIREQGEGAAKKYPELPAHYQNTADDGSPSLPHFTKFKQIRDAGPMPLTYPLKDPGSWTGRDHVIQDGLVDTFTRFRAALAELFAGRNPPDFVPLMISVGAGIQNCWKNGVPPRFG
ncbi:MAG: hypothetical protein RLY86_1604 [Pseudomonadota bacterium]|jgi:hypothetical protein